MAQLNFGLLDTSLPGQVGNAFLQGMRGQQDREYLIGQRQQQNALAQMAMQEKQRQQAQEQAFADALRAGGEPDINALFAANPERAYQYSNAQAQRQNAMTAQENARRKAQEDAAKKLREQAETKFYLPKFLTMAGVAPDVAKGIGMDDAGNFVDMAGQPVDLPIMNTGAEMPMNNKLSPEVQELLAAGMSDPKTRGIAMREAFKLYRDGNRPEKLPSKIAEFRAVQNMPTEERAAYDAYVAKHPSGQQIKVENIMPSTEQAMKSKGKEFGKFAVEATQAAQNSFDVAQDVNMIVDGLKGMGGGPVAQLKAWVGKVMPPGTDWAKMANMADLAHTVQTKLSPTMRIAGSGATSDFEMRAYMQSIPTLATTEQGRSLLAKYASRVSDRAQTRAEIVNEIEQLGKIPTPAEISREMKRRVPDRFFDDADRAFFGMKAQPAQSQSGGWGIQKVK